MDEIHAWHEPHFTHHVFAGSHRINNKASYLALVQVIEGSAVPLNLFCLSLQELAILYPHYVYNNALIFSNAMS